ncbi:hypothetical protein U1Q18_049634, partial [Sarracenia purpurea var. burkii]
RWKKSGPVAARVLSVQHNLVNGTMALSLDELSTWFSAMRHCIYEENFVAGVRVPRKYEVCCTRLTKEKPESKYLKGYKAAAPRRDGFLR